MAWIESHQTLANHPKTLKLARLLNVPRVTAVGHLQFLWWWALDYAQDGDLSRFDQMDIAVAADWQGDPPILHDALQRSGFVDEDGRLHDWHDYAGRLIERRKADAERKREARSKDVQRTGGGLPADGVRNRTVPNPTEPDPTEPDLVEHAPAAPKAKRAMAVPDDFPTGDEREWAYGEGFSEEQVNRQVELFRDHYRGHGKAMKDWPATFRNWMRRSRDDPRFAARASPGNGMTDEFAQVREQIRGMKESDPAIETTWRPR